MVLFPGARFVSVSLAVQCSALVGTRRAPAASARSLLGGARSSAPRSTLRAAAVDSRPEVVVAPAVDAPAAAAAAGVNKDAPRPVAPSKKTAFERYTQFASAFTNLFPLWTALFAAWGLKRPQDFAWLTTKYFTAGLAALMLSMGITLSPADFARVATRPNAVLVNFGLCYGMMPVLGLALGKAFQLDPALVAGMVLVGSINGGQASNLCTFIAKGSVALSVLMTTATTIGAIFMTPFLCKAMLGTTVPVDAAGIVVSTLQVVLAPIAIGMGLNSFAPKAVEACLPATPVIGVASTCLLVAAAVGQVADPIIAAGLGLQIPVMLLHLVGGVVGYWSARLGGFGETVARTMAIETAMKSSAFGFLLAKLHFGAAAVRVPSAVSVVWMALTGSSMAVVWRFLPVNPPKYDRKVKDRFEKIDILSNVKRIIGKKGKK